MVEVTGSVLGAGNAYWIPLLPILGSLLVFLIGRYLPEKGGPVAILMTLGSLIIAAATFKDALGLDEGEYFHDSMAWVTFPSVGGSDRVVWEMGVYVDPISALMGLIVCIVGFLVLVYSLGYMHGDEGLQRYYAVISLFIGVMLGVVYANNFLMMFMMWELVGLCSYLLIGHWYKKPEAAAAAKKAFLVTRIGDVMFIVGVIMIYNTFGTFLFTEIFELGDELAKHSVMLTQATLLLFGGAVGKSAQFPLHVWLPDAMEGPTTVSALIHAATMVKAGVFLVARSYPLLVHADIIAPTTIAWIGAITAFLAATMGLVAWDIKRVMAYSTISQLGYMMAALGSGATHEMGSLGYSAGMFHLLNHAFFKALLFLGAGSVIHAVHSNDMRVMGGLRKKMKVTAYTMLIGVMALAGLPPFSGFWSKDEVLSVALESNVIGNLGVFVLLGLTALITAFYAFRMWFLTFGGEVTTKEAEHAHESPMVMAVPLVILAGLAASTGFLGMPGIGAFQGFVAFGGPPHIPQWADVNLRLFVGSILLAALGAVTAYKCYAAKVFTAKAAIRAFPAGRGVHRLLVQKYYMDHLFLYVAERIVVPFTVAQNAFDQWGIDGVVNGIARGSFAAGAAFRRLQTGITPHYATMILVGVSLLVAVVHRQMLWGYIATVAGVGP